MHFLVEDNIFTHGEFPAHTSAATQYRRKAKRAKFYGKNPGRDVNGLDYFLWGWLQRHSTELNPVDLQTLKLASQETALETPIEQARASAH